MNKAQLSVIHNFHKRETPWFFSLDGIYYRQPGQKGVRSWRASEYAGAHSYYEIGEVTMPRIPDSHLQSVVFIYPSQQAALDGDQVGGSGFVVNMPTGVGTWRIRYVVTNQHVIDAGGHWVRLNHPGGIHVVHIPSHDWLSAPGGDDFALALLRLPEVVVPYELSLDTFAVTRDEVAKLKVGPGDEAYMVGRFIAHGGRITNNPIARFGSIALMPNPLELVRDGRGKDVEAYLVEMRSHAGFSGSAVFLLIPQNSFRGKFGDTSMDDNTTRFRLLGIDTGHKIDPLPVQEPDSHGEWRNVVDTRVPHYSDIAIVAPIWKVVDLLNREDVVAERMQHGADLEKRRGLRLRFPMLGYLPDASQRSGRPPSSIHRCSSPSIGNLLRPGFIILVLATLASSLSYLLGLKYE